LLLQSLLLLTDCRLLAGQASAFQRQVKLDPDLGVIIFDNVRLDSAGGRGKFIRRYPK